jgi:hypothetical protein
MMDLSDAEWQDCIRSLDENRRTIEAWPETDPDPTAIRCEFSRHRTLAHLRAAQETWLEAVLLFAAKDFPRIVRPHPWRLFTDRSYELVPWKEHHAVFLRDRAEWLAFVQRPGLDRERGGKLSGKVRTIESFTQILLGHENHHLAVLRK